MFAVTVLTSFDENDLYSLNFKGDISDNVLNLGKIYKIWCRWFGLFWR